MKKQKNKDDLLTTDPPYMTDVKNRGIQDPLHVVKQNGKYVVVSGHQRNGLMGRFRLRFCVMWSYFLLGNVYLMLVI